MKFSLLLFLPATLIIASCMNNKESVMNPDHSTFPIQSSLSSSEEEKKENTKMDFSDSVSIPSVPLYIRLCPDENLRKPPH